MKTKNQCADNHKAGISDETNRIESFLSAYSSPIILFLITFFLLLLISRPALYMNDELISVNQLHQISIGDQVLLNECKYGCYQNGTPSQYFEYKHNVLGYTLFLPLLSLPIWYFFSLFGDIFRLPIILTWSMIQLLLTIIISAGYPRYAKIAGLPLMYGGAVVSILLMMINLFYYHPFPFTAIDAPSETGAIILTNTILGALISVVLYQTALLIWKNKKVSLFCTASIFCCSSYLFWSGTAKDHILMTLILTLVTYYFISSIITKKQTHQYYAFMFIGLLAWVRPEMGLSIFIGSLVFLAFEGILDRHLFSSWHQTLRQILLSIVSTLIGSIPLCINNFITTKSIFIPPFYYYMSKTAPEGAQIWNSSTGIPAMQEAVTAANHLDGLSLIQVPSFISSYFLTTSPVQIAASFASILIRPESGNMSLAAVSPLFFSGLIILIGYIIWRRPSFEKSDFRVLALLSIFVVFVFIAYTRSLPGISSSSGITPDMRYFLPVYFLGGLIGFYPLVRWGRELILQITTKRYLFLMLTLAVGITFLIVLAMPSASYHEYIAVYMTLIYGVAALLVASFFAAKTGYCSHLWVGLILIVLIALPLSWQLIMDLFYSVGKAYGYPFWMPYLEYLIEKYLQYTIIT